MIAYQLSFLDPAHRAEVACIHYQAEDDLCAIEQARLRHFYLPAELRRSGELVASFEQESAPADQEKRPNMGRPEGR
jgi:hypothetical protein